MRLGLALLAIAVGACAFAPLACEGDDITVSDDDASVETFDATFDAATFDAGDAEVDADASQEIDAGPVERLFPSDLGSNTLPGCIFGSPQIYGPPGAERVIVVSNDGTVAAISPDTGNVMWSMKIPLPPGEHAYVLATPAIVGNTLFESYSTISTATSARDSARVVAIDLVHHVVDPTFPEVMLTASKPGSGDAGMIDFLPSHEVDRSPVIYAQPDPSKRGLLYVQFGNIRDIQPWHGWMFEIDLDRWHDEGAAGAVTGSMVDTPESECGTPDQGGSREKICGGGLWAPGGPEVTVTDGGLEILAVAGNGQLDLARRDYANTMMRLRPGLVFDPACDPACTAFSDGGPPSTLCMQTCADLFVPRIPDGGPLAPDDPACAGLDFWDCFAAHDWDLGADGPTRITLKNGLEVVVVPAKDGGLYLVDAAHLGTLYDRIQLAEPCGSAGDPCIADWAGMMVTKPETVWQDGEDDPLVVVPTLEFDHTHPANVVGVRVVTPDGGAPHFAIEWRAPSENDPLAKQVFRMQPTLPRIGVGPSGEPLIWIVDVDSSPVSGHGLLFEIRARDGAILSMTPLAGSGQRYARPLAWKDRVFAISCPSDNGPGHVEGYRVTP